HIAVVLFATIAQTIDWRGNQDPWLEVSSANTSLFEGAVQEYLGRRGNEPRKGQETDYRTALEDVHRLCEGLTSPPFIIFMTDGGNEPHFLFTKGTDDAQRQRQLASLPERQRQVFEQVSSDGRRWLKPGSGAQIFNSRAEGFGRSPLTPEQQASVRSGI